MFFDCADRIADRRPFAGGGVAVSDIDRDGRQELLLAGHGCANRALKWQDGRLVDALVPALADPAGRTVALAAADIDGDGAEELYVVNSDDRHRRGRQSDRLFTAFGNRWLDLFGLPDAMPIANRAPGRAVACLDRLGHGRYGFVVANARAPLAVFELDSRGTLVNAAEAAGLDLTLDADGLLPLPLFSPVMDLLVAARGGANAAFRNQGDGQFEEIAHALGLDDPHADARALAALDADFDGLFDLACGTTAGAHRLFVRAAEGGFGDVAPDEMADEAAAACVLAADFDNDGFEELLFLNRHAPHRLFGWRNERWTPIDLGDLAEAELSPGGAAVADIDGDGRLELLVSPAATAPAPVALFRSPPTDFAWLRVMPMTIAGAPARGATVTVEAGDRPQHRVICAGSGGGCQNEPVAHFGLADTRTIDKVAIHWPDGTSAIIEAPPINRFLPVPYPPT